MNTDNGKDPQRKTGLRANPIDVDGVSESPVDDIEQVAGTKRARRTSTRRRIKRRVIRSTSASVESIPGSPVGSHPPTASKHPKVQYQPDNPFDGVILELPSPENMIYISDYLNPLAIPTNHGTLSQLYIVRWPSTSVRVSSFSFLGVPNTNSTPANRIDSLN